MKSLKARSEALADSFIQLEVLNTAAAAAIPRFQDKIAAAGGASLYADKVTTFQLNIGKMCNQTCAHCHVDAAPDRKEMMSRADLSRCLAILKQTAIDTVDITGGAPEMHPDFRWFVEECFKLGKKIINRCNLTIIMANKKYADLPQFFAAHQVHLVSSLPFYSAIRTDSQRGAGVFEDSIAALKRLNEVGYGKEGTGLVLDLVYNPTGAFLPAAQAGLEAEFKRQLKRKNGIEFNHLFVITNMPISRFLAYLIETNNYEAYMEKLVAAFNPATIQGLMCRNTISVSWDGYLYDCDFNQMLDLKVATPQNHINNFDARVLDHRAIVLNQHCYGCTAGAGSSCGGEIA